MYSSARDLFEAAREAARDAERIARQLDAMDAAEGATGGGGFSTRIRSTPDPDRIGREVSARLDQRARLTARQEEDYRLIDAACAVLYPAFERVGEVRGGERGSSGFGSTGR